MGFSKFVHLGKQSTKFYEISVHCEVIAPSKFLPQLYLQKYRESVAGSVIQATGTVEFEDGLWIGNRLKA